jgi:hypothetical protein
VSNSNGKPTPEFVASFDYHDELDQLLFQVLRREPGRDDAKKDFIQRRCHPKGGWVWALAAGWYRRDAKGDWRPLREGQQPGPGDEELPAARRVLYRLPELLRAPKDRPVFIPEGEKKADALAALGLLATCNAGGANKWNPEYTEDLKGRHVFILPDNDEPGRQHAQGLAVAIHKAAASVTILDLPGLPPKGDIIQWLEIPGNDRAAFDALLARVPEWRPPDPPRPAATTPQSAEAAPPLPLDEPAAAPPFPLEVLPERLQQYVEELAWAMSCPTDFAGAAVLALGGAAIGNRRRLQIKQGYNESACLFLAIVAPPGCAKSPSLEKVAGPLHAAQARCVVEWRDAKKAWEKDDPKKRGEKPTLRRVIVDDFTFEKLKSILVDNPEGVALPLDELSQVVAAINQYKQGRGSDRQMLLKLWSSASIITDRSGDEDGPAIVPRPFVGIVGNVQPAVVQALKGDRRRGDLAADDGGLDRFLFAYPDRAPAVGETWREVSEEAERLWADVVESLLALKMEPNPLGPRPPLLRLDLDARRVWQRFTEALADEMNAEDFPNHLRGPWSKLKAYCARLALIVDCLRRACGEQPGGEVGAESLERAVRLVDYFKAHARKAYSAIGADERLEDARRILDSLARNPEMETFTRAELYRNLRRYFGRPEALEPPLRLLCEHRYLTSSLPDRGGRPGPNPERYTVNPLWDRATRTRDPQVARDRGREAPAGAEPVDPVDSVYGSAGGGTENGEVEL